MNDFIRTIISTDPAERDRDFTDLARASSTPALLLAGEELEAFRRGCENLYQRVRASLFLYAIYRFHLAGTPDLPPTGFIPPVGFADLQTRRYEGAIAHFRKELASGGPNGTLCSALAEAYHHLAFQTLADQVRRSVRATQGNRWMFRVGHADDHPLRIHPILLHRANGTLLYPVIVETTPVRLDLSHSGWSDIFFLGMDYPQGARVLNISIDLGVYGRDATVRPPVETYIRVIPEPVLRLTSIDLETTRDITELHDLFNFGNDYLSLLKAGVIAAGVVPPSFESGGQSLAAILARVVAPGMGLELVTCVNDIPKGSRLAVSTNLLAGIISVLMRATGQTATLEGPLQEAERRLVVSRAILGEWLGGSGGGWQDSGGIWPGVKIIHGAVTREGDPEFGMSAGCLLPRYHVLGASELHPEFTARLAESLVLIHGGLAQNVGPILEMVTEKYLLRAANAWQGRAEMRAIFDGMLTALRDGDVRALARLTTQNWDGPLKTIIPWVSNSFTETIIARARTRFGDDFWGFLMLGGMSGGGMAMFTAPARRAEFRDAMLDIMRESKEELSAALPFAIDPTVYTFAINPVGSTAFLRTGGDAVLPIRYYALQVPELVRQHPDDLPYLRRAELDHVTAACTAPGEAYRMLRTIVSHLFHVADSATGDNRAAWDAEAAIVKTANGFDALQHEQLRADLRAGRLGLVRNRLPADTEISDVSDGDLLPITDDSRARGEAALRAGRVAILTLAAGVGSRWTTGAGVIKALNPFARFAGAHRNFLDIHLAKTRRTEEEYGISVPHIISTSYLTHASIADYLQSKTQNRISIIQNQKSKIQNLKSDIMLSVGQSISQRLVPMARDLEYLWEEMPQEMLDTQQQKVREATRGALLAWARAQGEGSDYTDNLPAQRFNPPGHWYEVANMLRNGTLARLLNEHPEVETLLLHNIDTLGANLDPMTLGAHLAGGHTCTFEVIPRWVDDQGGGLARINGRLRLLEGLAQPREDDDLRLRYYNSMTTWIQLDPLLALFGLSRADLCGPADAITEAVRHLARRIPTYVTIKEVKRRWGHGQEDIFPVAQFEKLWGDITALPDLACAFLAAPRLRGQQLKDPAQLDPWANDGSREYVEEMCRWSGEWGV